MTSLDRIALKAERVLFSISRLLLYLAIGVISVIVIIISCSVFMRYVLFRPLVFTEEVVGLLSVLLIFLSLPYVAISGKNIEVNLLIDRFRPGVRVVLRRIGLALGLCFTVGFTVVVFSYADETYRIGSRSDILSVVLFPWMGAVAVCMAILSAVLLLRIVRESPEQAAGAESAI